MKTRIWRFLALTALAVVAVLPTWAASVTPGVWCTDLNAAKSYAVANKMPLFCFYGVNGCSYCTKGVTAVNSSTFKGWMAKRKIVMLYLHPDSWSYGDQWVFASNDYQADAFPACRIWWPKTGSAKSGVVGRAFVGRLNDSYLKGVSGTRLEDKLINAIESVIGSWKAAAAPAPAPAANATAVAKAKTVAVKTTQVKSASKSAATTSTASASATSATVSVSDVWKKARKLYGVVTEGREVTGCCEVKCGKANKKGEAKVSAKLTFFDGRKRVTYKSMKIAAADNVSFEWTKGDDFGLTLKGSSFSGGSSATGVASGALGGEVSGAHYLEFDGLTGDDELNFEAAKKKWTFPATAGTKKSKLSYSPASGLFKGKIKLSYDPDRDEDDPKRNRSVSLKVNGVVLETQFHGVAVYKDFDSSVGGK